MRSSQSVWVVILFLLAIPVWGQQSPPLGPRAASQVAAAPPQRDPQGLQVLATAYNSIGGAQRGAISDVMLYGTIASPAAPDVPIGTFVAKARGFDFSLETDRNGHQTIYRVLKDRGSVSIDGKIKHLLPYNTEGLSLDLFPLFSRWSGYSQTTSAVQPVKQNTSNGALSYVVHVEVPVTHNSIFDNDQGKIDVSVDGTTGFVASTEYRATEGRYADRRVTVQTDYGDYRQFGTVVAPTTITRSIGGHPFLRFHVTTAQFNSGFSDSDFVNQGGAR